MVPTTTVAFIAFFLLVIPGASYEILRSRNRLPREESSFLHISRILLAGTLITVLAFMILVTVYLIEVRLAVPTTLASIPDLLRSDITYTTTHFRLILKTLLLQIALSVLLAIIFSDLRSTGTNVIHETDAWHAVGELLVKSGQTAWASVRLKNGSEVTGYYFGASTELDPSKRELLLRAPLSFRADNEKPALSLDTAWQLMTIPGSEIAHIATAYVSNGKKPLPVRWRNKVCDWTHRNFLTWQAASIALIGALAAAVFVH